MHMRLYIYLNRWLISNITSPPSSKKTKSILLISLNALHLLHFDAVSIITINRGTYNNVWYYYFSPVTLSRVVRFTGGTAFM